MRWLTAILALLVLVLGAAAFPAAVEHVSAWMAHRSENVQSINYLSREIHELSASRRRSAHRHHPDPNLAPGDN